MELALYAINVSDFKILTMLQNFFKSVKSLLLIQFFFILSDFNFKT